MGVIRIETGDWTRNAGLVGIMNIFNSVNKKYVVKNNFIEFDSSLLENFAIDYFTYFQKRYIDHLSYSVIIKKGQTFLDLKEWNENYIENFNKYVETTKKQLTSNSYKAAYQMMPQQTVDIVELEKKLAKIKLKAKQTIEDVQDKIEESRSILKSIIAFLKLADVKKYILAKNIAYTIIDKFWGNVSFLNSQAKNKDMFKEYEEYFIEPVRQYYQEDHQKDKYCCLTCSQPIKKLSKPEAYDLAWLNRMGVDMSRKTSHFWNLNSGTCYICPLCNLIYSCIPAGFTVIRGQGYFVNSSNKISMLNKLNNNGEEEAVRSDETIQLAELKSYYQLIDYMEGKKTNQASKEIDNIQIIKFRSQTNSDQRRPYTFNVLSKDKLRVIQNSTKTLSRLVNKIIKLSDDSYINVYQAVLDRLYQNRNQFDLIGLLFRNSLPSRGEEPIRGVNVIREIIYLNNHFLGTINKNKEDDSMSGYSSYVKRDTIVNIEKAGKVLSTVYVKKNAANKLSGITYRLLNALKTKNTGKFMDTFINAHMFGGQPIPTNIIDVLQDEDKLQTLGYAFVVGLRAGKPINDEKEKTVNE